MKKLLLGLLVAVCCSLTMADSRPEVARYTKAYSGDEGIEVFVTRIGPAEKGEVLLQIQHVDHPLDGVIQKARVDSNERGRRYVVQKDGKDYVALIIEGSSGEVFLSSLPNNPRSWHVSFDTKLSAQATPEHILTRWLESGKK